MLTNYLKTAYRSLYRNRVYAFVSIAGLAVGTACCVLIFLFVRSELSADAVFADADRIFRVDSDWERADMGLPFTTLAPASTKMQEVLPEVEDRARLWAIDLTVGQDETWLRREAFVVDPSFPDFFGLPVTRGRAALPDPRSAMLRADLARALFGTTDAVGRTFELKTWRAGTQTYTVSGVWEQLPDNSVTRLFDLDTHLLLPNTNEDFAVAGAWTSWQSPYIVQFVKLSDAASAEAVQAKLEGFIDRYAVNAWKEGRLELVLNPLRELRLTDEGRRGWQLVWALLAAGVLLLLIAAANFTNLATARALTRAREVGVRRAVGARRGQLARQFLLEALLVSTAATAVGAGLASVALGPFMRLTGREMVLVQPWDAWTLAALGALALVTGLLAGAYPAFVLTRYRPAAILGGGTAGASIPGGARLRQTLVIAQFAVAIVMLIGVSVVHRQTSFMLEQDLGFDRENVLVADSVERDTSPEGIARLETVKAELRRVPGVQAVSLSASVPGSRAFAGGSGASQAWRRPGWPPGRDVDVSVELVDDDYLATFGLTLKQGRFFSDTRPADSTSVVLNEAAARAFGLDQAADQTLLTGPDSARAPVKVVGIVEDFHQQTLHAPVKPLALVPVRYGNYFYKYLTVRTARGVSPDEGVQAIRGAWSRVLPATPFRYRFVDDRVEQAYQAERRLQRVAGVTAALALFVACLGLFGLAAYAAEQRTREVGIRKVLGASVAGLVALLSKDFLRLVAVAFVMAAPVAYLLMQRWLEDFAYRIEISWPIFLFVGLAALVIALATVSYQAVRAALADPVESLRYE